LIDGAVQGQLYAAGQPGHGGGFEHSFDGQIDLEILA
jgi:hypothetical protein